MLRTAWFLVRIGKYTAYIMTPTRKEGGIGNWQQQLGGSLHKACPFDHSEHPSGLLENNLLLYRHFQLPDRKSKLPALDRGLR